VEAKRKMVLVLSLGEPLVADVPGLMETFVFGGYSIQRVSDNVLKIGAYVDEEMKGNQIKLQEACSAGDFATVQMLAAEQLKLKKKAENFDLVHISNSKTFKLSFTA
jgi:hypothetical protein